MPGFPSRCYWKSLLFTITMTNQSGLNCSSLSYAIFFKSNTFFSCLYYLNLLKYISSLTCDIFSCIDTKTGKMCSVLTGQHSGESCWNFQGAQVKMKLRVFSSAVVHMVQILLHSRYLKLNFSVLTDHCRAQTSETAILISFNVNSKTFHLYSYNIYLKII